MVKEAVVQETLKELQSPAELKSELAPVRERVPARLLSFRVLLSASLAVSVLIFAIRPTADPDIFWHLRNSTYLLQNHHWIRRDMYASTTLGMPWINHEWLAELPFYAAYQALGMRGLLLATVLLLETIFLGLFAFTRQVSGDLKTAWITTGAGVLLGTVSFGPRTLLFGWICLLLELLLLERFEQRRGQMGAGQSFWPLIPLFLLWVNLHGSWLLGLSLFAIYILCGCFTFAAGSIARAGWTARERKGLGSVFLLSAAALFINPYGWKLPAYPFDFAFRQTLNVASIEEWQPLDMQSPRARILLAILAASFLAQLVRRRRWAPYQLAFVVIGLFSAFTHMRFLFLASLIALPYLAQDMPWPRVKQPGRERPLLHAALLLLLLASSAHLIRTRSATVDEAAGYPVKALPFLRAFHPQGRVFNSFLWGGYLELYAPNIPVFIDSRVDIFERRGVFRDYLDAVALKNSLAVLDRDSVRYVLFDDGSPLTYLLRQSAGWKILYQDDVTVLFERVAPAPGSALARR